MATPAQTATGAASYQGLSDKLACIIYLLNTNGMTAAAIAAGAKTYQGLSDKEACIIYLLANGGGGGGGGSGSVLVGSYGGIAPTASPSGNATAFDLDSGKIWAWDGATWTPFVGG